MRVNIGWSNCADIDLHVTDPCGQEIWFSRKSVSCNGSTGTLDHDANAGGGTCDNNPQENIRWSGNPPRGTYLVKVKYYTNDVGSTQVRVTQVVEGAQSDRNITLNSPNDIYEYSFTY